MLILRKNNDATNKFTSSLLQLHPVLLIVFPWDCQFRMNEFEGVVDYSGCVIMIFVRDLPNSTQRYSSKSKVVLLKMKLVSSHSRYPKCLIESRQTYFRDFDLRFIILAENAPRKFLSEPISRSSIRFRKGIPITFWHQSMVKVFPGLWCKNGEKLAARRVENVV